MLGIVCKGFCDILICIFGVIKFWSWFLKEIFFKYRVVYVLVKEIFLDNYNVN